MTTLQQVEPSVPTTAPVSPTRSTIVNPVRRGPILLALHGLTSSSAAISSAQLLAAPLGLDVEVVTVTPGEPAYAEPLDIMPDREGFAPTSDVEHEREIRSAIRQALITDQKWPVSVRHGPPAREVARAALAMDATMIIVNSTPPAGVLRTMAGVFATELVRRVRCPVLAVSAPLAERPRRIVAAMDFSPASLRAAQAAALVADAGAVMTLLHVPVPVKFARPHLDRSGAPIGADTTTLFDRVENELRPYLPADLTFERVVADGSTSSAILDQARLKSADLIVAGTHGPNRLERFFVGSTAVSLLHHSSCAVLIAPAPSSAERVRLELEMSDTSMIDDSKDWADLLASMTARNRGRMVSMQIADTPTAHAEDFIFREAAYDSVDCYVEIRLNDTSDGRRSLTRTIGHPRSIIISRGPDGQERALEIVQDRGHTSVLFHDREEETTVRY